jgi:hypothetical protein
MAPPDVLTDNDVAELKSLTSALHAKVERLRGEGKLTCPHGIEKWKEWHRDKRTGFASGPCPPITSFKLTVEGLTTLTIDTHLTTEIITFTIGGW